MSRRNGKLRAILLGVLFAFHGVAIPFNNTSALSHAEGQALAEEFINVAALYKCLNEMTDGEFRDIMYENEPIEDAIISAGSKNVEDQWLGTINCKDAWTKVVGNDTVSIDTIDDSLIGWGYSYSTLDIMYAYSFDYQIYDGNSTSHKPGWFSFYQGWIDKYYGDASLNTTTKPGTYDPSWMIDNSSEDYILWFLSGVSSFYLPNLDIYYDNHSSQVPDPRFDGWERLKSIWAAHGSSIDQDDIDNPEENIFDWQVWDFGAWEFFAASYEETGDPCKSICIYDSRITGGGGRPLAYGGYNGVGPPNSIDKMTIRWSERTFSNNMTYTRLDGIGKYLANGLSELYLNGKTPEEYLASHEELAYVLQGRYLFNGDGQFKNGCNGVSVDAEDERIGEFDSRDDVFWKKSNAYVKETKVYSPKDSIYRKTYRTKFVADNVKGQGVDKEVTLYPGATAQSCSEVAKAFNTHSDLMASTLGATYKGAVLGYLSPVTVESILGNDEPEPATENPPTTSVPPATTKNPTTDEPAGDDDPNPESGTTVEDASKKCYMNADEFGWILCPMIEGLKETILGAYEAYVIPALQVNAGLFHAGDGENDGTYKAWSIFRTIANIIFLIFFVIAIFSQTTGLGVDSFGIKKMIPKMLIVAILVNLSFIICQVAIDVGNILGRNIGGLFNNITQSITIPDEIIVDSEKVTKADAMSSFTSSVINPIICLIVAVLGAAVVLSQGLAVVIPVLMAFISILIAIITLVAILGVRQAAIVLLVASSPIAFVCYMLPNTKPIFDKWFNAFKGLLIAFPVCSAIVYGGNMVSAILLQSANGNTWLVIAAAAVGVAPIFAIPKVIKGCMGAISMGMARFGSKMTGKAKGAAHKRLDNSFLTRRRDYNQQRRAQKAAAKASAYGAKRGRRTMKHYGNEPLGLSARQQRNYFAAQGAVNAHNDEEVSAYSGQFAMQTDDQIAKGLTDAAASGKLDGNMMIAGLSSITDESQKAAVLRSLSKSGNYQKLMDNDPSLRGRVASSLEGDNSIVNRGIANVMRNSKGNTDIDGMFTDGRLADEVHKFGADAMATQNDKLFKTEGVADLLSDEQLKAGVTSEYSGDTAAAFHKMMTDKVSSTRKGNVIKSMTASDMTHLTKMQHNGREVGSLSALGGASAITANNSGAITTLNSVAGDDLRGSMQNSVRSELGVI